MKPLTDDIEEIWWKTRHGARASRGFRYQDAVTAMLMLRVWQGAFPGATVVPEGLDDVVIETPAGASLLQVKSKAPSAVAFTATKLAEFNAQMDERVTLYANAGVDVISTQLVLERSPNSSPVGEIHPNSQMYAGKQPDLVISDPLYVCTEIIAETFELPLAPASLVAQSVVTLAGELASANGGRSYTDRWRVGRSDMEQILLEAVRAVDANALKEAVANNICIPVDFRTALPDSRFYEGVNVSPGHIVAGLAISRPREVDNILEKLAEFRAVALTGPSGCGKSGLQWLVSFEARHRIRWYRLTSAANPQHLSSVINFIAGVQPRLEAPIGIVIDDIGSGGFQLWRALTAELANRPGLYVLGSVRNEDRELIAGSPDHCEIPVSFDPEVAEHIWQRLRDQGKTELGHWLEAYEDAQGLLLEFTHILTRGERMAKVISAQVARRREEKREAELAILRVCSIAGKFGAAIAPKPLASLIDISASELSLAAKRLFDEHLVCQLDDGTICGLHELRSAELVDQCHDGAVLLEADSLELALSVVTIETLAKFILEAFRSFPDRTQKFVALLGQRALEEQSEFVAAALTGLGIAALDRIAEQWTQTLRRCELEPAHWPIATMMLSARQTVSGQKFPDIEALERINQALAQADSLHFDDFRQAFLDGLADAEVAICVHRLDHCDAIFSSLAPILHFPAPNLEALNINIDCDGDVLELAESIRTVDHVDPNIAQRMVEKLGGTETLLASVKNGLAWVSQPKIVSTSEFRIAVEAHIYCVADTHHSTAHDRVVQLCDILFGCVPPADGVIVKAVTPTGYEIAWPGTPPLASKRMPREYAPPKSLQRWNQLFNTLVAMRASAPSMTVYAETAASLVSKTRRMLEFASRDFCRSKQRRFIAKHADELEHLAKECNAFSAPASPVLNTSFLPIVGGLKITEPTTGWCAAICGNLLPRMLSYDSASENRGIAAFCYDLVRQADDILESHLWRFVSNSPVDEIQKIKSLLADLDAVLREMVFAPESFVRVAYRIKRELPGKVVSLGARLARLQAEQRLEAEKRSVADALQKTGISCRVEVASSDDSLIWPSGQFVIGVESRTLLDFLSHLEELDAAVCAKVAPQRRTTFVPILAGHAICEFSMILMSGKLYPGLETPKQFAALIGASAFRHDAIIQFDQCVAAGLELAGLYACRDLTRLHPEEAALFDSASQRMNSALCYFEDLEAGDSQCERLGAAVDTLFAIRSALEENEDALRYFPNLAQCTTAIMKGEADEQMSVLLVIKHGLISHLLGLPDEVV